MSEFDSASNRL